MDKIEHNLEKLKDSMEHLQEAAVAQSNVLQEADERDARLNAEFLALSKELLTAKTTACDLRLKNGKLPFVFDGNYQLFTGDQTTQCAVSKIWRTKLSNSTLEVSLWTERLAKANATAQDYKRKIADKKEELLQVISDHETRMKKMAHTFRTAPSVYERENLEAENVTLEEELAKLKQKLKSSEVNIEMLKTKFNSGEELNQSSLLGDSSAALSQVMYEYESSTTCKAEEEVRSFLQQEQDLLKQFNPLQ